MSYHPRARPKRATALGDVAGNVVSNLASLASMANDPYAQELICRIRQVVGIETGGTVPGCSSVNIGIASPAGLRKPVVAMRSYVWAEQHKPWSYPAVITAVVGVPFLLGYLVGRK